MDFNCNIQGMEQLKANSEKLAKEARKAASASVLRQAEMVRDAIRTKAPQGPTGNLKRSAIAKLMPEKGCLLYTSPSPRDQRGSRMPSSA